MQTTTYQTEIGLGSHLGKAVQAARSWCRKAVVVVCTGLLFLPAPPATAEEVHGAACLLNLTLTSSDADLTPKDPIWAVSTGSPNTCVSTAAAVPFSTTGSLTGSLSAAATPGAALCAAGLLDGILTFDTGVTSANTSSIAVGVMVGSVLVLAMTSELGAGVGVFHLNPLAGTGGLAACATGADVTYDYLGTFAFAQADLSTG